MNWGEWIFLFTQNFIFLVHRVRIAVSCRMNFDDYPLDGHSCQFQVGSCKYRQHARLGSSPIPILCRLRHHRDCQLLLFLHLRRGAAAEPPAHHQDCRPTCQVQGGHPAVRHLRCLRLPGPSPEEANTVPRPGKNTNKYI